MSAKTSVKYYRPPTKVSVAVRRAVSIAVLFALLIVSGGIVSFASANNLMRRKPEQLASFSSNVMPPFQVIGFQSLDEQTTLSGWMFPAKGEPISTVILVHDSNRNRLQFGIDMPALYEFFVEAHYNVLSFDLRHSGKSEGQLTAYGYAEWEDVIAAINYARQFTTTKDVLLFGFGSGVTSALFAWSRLPERAARDETASEKSPTAPAENLSAAEKAINQRIAKLGFDQSYVRGVLLDTPCVSPDNYIQAEFRHGNLLDRMLLQYTVPYAVRLSASSSSQRSLVTILTRIQRPVFIAYSDQDSWVGRKSILPLVKERLRLHPDTTAVYVDPKPGYVEGLKNDQGAYFSALQDFLDRYVG